MIEYIALLLAIPSGIIISYLARDELVEGRKYFKILILISAIITIYFWKTEFKEISLTAIFIGITAITALVKSKDKKWTKKRL